MSNNQSILINVIKAAAAALPPNTQKYIKGDTVKYYTFTLIQPISNQVGKSNVSEIYATIENVNTDGTYDIKLAQPPFAEEKAVDGKDLYAA